MYQQEKSACDIYTLMYPASSRYIFYEHGIYEFSKCGNITEDDLSLDTPNGLEGAI